MWLNDGQLALGLLYSGLNLLYNSFVETNEANDCSVHSLTLTLVHHPGKNWSLINKIVQSMIKAL